MKRTRRNHGTAFKAKVAVVALKSDKTLTKLAEHFGGHPTQITDWKPPWLAQAVDVWGGTTWAVGLGDEISRATGASSIEGDVGSLLYN